MKFIWNQTYFLMIITALAWSGNAITAKGLNDLFRRLASFSGDGWWQFPF